VCNENNKNSCQQQPSAAKRCSTQESSPDKRRRLEQKQLNGCNTKSEDGPIANTRSAKILNENLRSQSNSNRPQRGAISASRNPVSRFKSSLDLSKLPFPPIQSIDLTHESDDETSPAMNCPTRQDLLELTGSISTAVDLKDLEGLEPSGRAVEECVLPDSTCKFLKELWVGQDKKILFKRGTGAHTVQSAGTLGDQAILGTISANGMGSFALSSKDLSCLEGPDWLNDEVVNAYMCLLQIRNDLNIDCCTEASPGDISTTEVVCKMPKCLFFNSFFYALLRNPRDGYCYLNVKRWGRRFNISEMDRVFLPINISNSHWCLAVVFPQEHEIHYYDSLGGKNPCCLNLLERYLQDEGRFRNVKALTGSWQKKNFGPPEIPGQGDGCSCGVFVCAFADCLSAGHKPKGFMQHDMPTIRRLIRDFFIGCRM
jgi:hypothetical protein